MQSILVDLVELTSLKMWHGPRAEPMTGHVPVVLCSFPHDPGEERHEDASANLPNPATGGGSVTTRERSGIYPDPVQPRWAKHG